MMKGSLHLQTQARAPTRIDLGGGWTDVPPFSDDEGGFVCNIAINRYATATVISSAQGGAESDETSSESALAMAALRRARKNTNGCTPSLKLVSDFPVAAGLGGSSAAGVASLGALLHAQGEQLSRNEIAELSRRVEVEDLGVPGGRQDHYAAAYGGALGLTFEQRGVTVERIALSDSLREEIELRFILLYTGQSRISGATISAVLDAYKSRDLHVCGALRKMRELARASAQLLASGSVDDLALLIGDQWIHQRSLHKGITTALIDQAIKVASQSGCLGAKALGASGGGSVLFIARSGDEEKLRAAVSNFGQLLPFRIDEGGLTVGPIDSTG
jgi:D-glycero-alpha-D-manno-heptose-7-phosphate kinase